MTQLLYNQSPYLYKTMAHIVKAGADEKGAFVIFDATIFYPQGGGQPADQGSITINNARYQIYDARLINDQVYHYLDKTFEGLTEELTANTVAFLEVDSQRRVLNSRYHTAGHLLSAVIEQVYSQAKAIKGNHIPGQAHVEFTGDFYHEFDKQLIQDKVNNVLQKNGSVILYEMQSSSELQQRLSYTIPARNIIRMCHIENFAPLPCGGTHVKNLAEIGVISITSIKIKKNIIKISYEVA